MRNPLMTVKRHEKALKLANEATKKMNEELWSVEAELRNCEKEVLSQHEIIDKVIPKLIHTNMRFDDHSRQYTVCVNLDRSMVEHAFEIGNDEHIRYVVSSISRAIERKMIQYNFTRSDRM